MVVVRAEMDIHTHRNTDTDTLTDAQTDWLKLRIYTMVVVRAEFYGVVPKGSSIFLGSLYKELWHIAPRDKPPEKKIPSRNTVFLEGCRILSQEHSDSCILYFNVIFHGK